MRHCHFKGIWGNPNYFFKDTLIGDFEGFFCQPENVVSAQNQKMATKRDINLHIFVKGKKNIA